MRQAKRGISELYSRKIKKANKAPKTLVYNNQEYEIENWAQCERCNIWRTVKRPPKKAQHFQCKQAGKECHKRQKTNKKLVTLAIQAH